ncbi:MAG: T9SS type A sorting domain-containing protein [bacterium]
MKTQILLISCLCMFAYSIQAQVQQRKATLPSGPERSGIWINPPQPGFKPERMVVPVNRTMFDSSGYLWKWDTIMCYNIASGDNPFQRVSRTYNSFGEQLTLLFERRQGSLAWENYAREADTYDSAGNWVGQLQEVWQNNAWVNFQKQEFVYNANGDQVDWKRMMWDSTAWDNGWHYSWHFDANGLNDTAMYQAGQDSLWLNNWLAIPAYDGNGYYTGSLTYIWLNNGWEVTSRDSSTNNSNGNLLTRLNQDWVNSSWVNTSFHTLTWDTAGNQLSYLYQLWQNNAWENVFSNYFTYDAGGNMVMEIDQCWMSGAWVNCHRVLYDYDTSINLLSETSQDWVNAAWRHAYTQQYTYDSWGNSLTGKIMHWFNGWQPYDGGLPVFANHQLDGSVDLTEVYRYTAVVDSIMVFTEPTLSPGQVSLFPNPAHSIVYLSSPGVSNAQNRLLTMYDLRGQLILSKQMVNETTGIDVSGLKPGVYFVRFSDDRMTRVLKFVKD